MSNTITATAHACLISSRGLTAFCGLVAPFTLTGNPFGAVQNIGTGAEAVSMGDLTSAGLRAVVNRDATNYLELGLDSGVSTKKFAKLRAGQFALWVPYDTATVYGKANTAAVDATVIACGAATLGTVVRHSAPLGAAGITEQMSLEGVASGLTVSGSVNLTASETSIGARHQYFWTASLSYQALSIPNASRMCAIVNTHPTVDAYLCLANDGSDKVALLKAGGGFAFLPPPATATFYLGADDTAEVEVLDYL